MKLVIAIVRPEALDNVKQSLFDAEIHKMTVHNVRGCGQQKGGEAGDEEPFNCCR